MMPVTQETLKAVSNPWILLYTHTAYIPVPKGE